MLERDGAIKMAPFWKLLCRKYSTSDTSNTVKPSNAQSAGLRNVKGFHDRGLRPVDGL